MGAILERAPGIEVEALALQCATEAAAKLWGGASLAPFPTEIEAARIGLAKGAALVDDEYLPRIAELLAALRDCRSSIAGFTATEGAADHLFNEIQRIHRVAVAAIASAEA